MFYAMHLDDRLFKIFFVDQGCSLFVSRYNLAQPTKYLAGIDIPVFKL
jgi:hypothetical protein